MAWSGAFRTAFTAPPSPIAAEAQGLANRRRREEKEDNRRGDSPSPNRLGEEDDEDGKAVRKPPLRLIVWPRAIPANR